MLESKRLPREINTFPSLQKKIIETIDLYSPPLFQWSRWQPVLSLTASANVNIKAEPMSGSENEFNIQVRYFDENGNQKISDFSVLREISFKAGRPDRMHPDAQTIAVRLRSTLNGQKVRLRVDWGGQSSF